MNVGALSKMQIPINEKSSLNLMHGFITFQIYLNTTKSFTIEIAISDANNGKKRILLSACSKEFIINQLHCRIPIINIPTGVWINFSIDILSFVSECFKGQAFRAIDSICLSADCKVRRICGMRQLYTLSEEEFLNGDDTALPKGFILPDNVKSINLNFDMNYINQTVEMKNFKNNNPSMKDKRQYPKTSQSKRETKLANTVNLHKNQNFNQINENRKINTGNKINRNNIRSKSIKKEKIKNNPGNDINQIKNKNNCNLREYVEVNKGSNKNLRKLGSLNKFENKKKEIKENIKKNDNNNNTKKKSKEKMVSKSVGKVYLKNKTNTFIKGKNSKINTNICSKNEYNIKKKNDMKEDKVIIVQDNNIDNKNMIMNININNGQPQIKQRNQVIFNNYNMPKEELNLFNTFNYKDLESKENTLIINQSNFNNASIPEVVDLDTNITLLKNMENDANYNNDIIHIDNKNFVLNKKNENSIMNQDQVDSLLADKILNTINDTKNDRPYTPPLQKIIPVNNENNPTLNNVNISRINESIIQNHYCDLVYDNATGRYYDKKTKIFYDFK